MSLLPQRKKTAEEIAQLRDNLGVPTDPAASPASVDEAPAPAEKPKRKFQKVIQPGTPAAGNSQLPGIEPSPGITPPPAPEVKPVRSLKKSEQLPSGRSVPAPSTTDSPIPARRHSKEELEDMRRRQALSMLDNPPPNPKLAKAHGLVIGLGYLCAITGAGCFIIRNFPLTATASCAGAALIIALYIFLRRPISRHHAGFIAVITLIVSAFGTLHYFPQLQYAS